MIVLGGGAFACFALGYLGLHYMGGESITDEEEQIKKEVKEEINEMYNEVDNDNKENSKEKKKVTGWGQFWKNAFNEETTNNDVTDNGVDVSDYN